MANGDGSAFDIAPQDQPYRMAPDRLAMLLAGKLPNPMGGATPDQPPAEVPIIRNRDFGRPVKLSDKSETNDTTDVSPTPPIQSTQQSPMPDLPTPPKYAPPSDITTPIAQNDPRYKPSWARVLLGSLAGGAMAYAHQPDAYERMEGAINAPRNRAEENRRGQLSAYDEQFNRSMQDFNSRLAVAKEGREQALTSSRMSELEARGNKYDNAIDPNSIEQDEQGNWSGTTYGGKRVPTGAPRWAMRQGAGDKLRETNTEREKEADRLGLKGEQRTYYIANGKLREPGVTVITGRDEAKTVQVGDKVMQFNPKTQRYDIEVGPGKTANRPAHAKDRQSFDSSWQKRFESARKPFDAQRKEVMKQYGIDKDPKAWSDEATAAVNNIESEWAKKSAELQQEKDAEAEQYQIYNQQTPAPRQSAPSAPAAQPAPKAAPQNNAAPTERKVKGPNGQVITAIVKNGKWVNKQTGNPL